MQVALFLVVVLIAVGPEIVFICNSVFDQFVRVPIIPLPFPLDRPRTVIRDLQTWI